MQITIGRLLLVLISALVLACGGPVVTEVATPTAPPLSPTTAPAPTATAAPSPTPAPVRQDVLASRLVIPSLEIDSPVQTSERIPYTYTPPPGCPPRPEDTDTVVVPSEGIATPVEGLEGLENKAWIFGHSRWQGAPRTFLRLQDLNLGDELFVDGVDRTTGEPVVNQRYVVDGIYLTDVDSGETLLSATGPADIPMKPQVILQTSVREDGAGKQWILDENRLLAKATNLVQGDLDDPCKYLLLFVVADLS